MSVHLFEESNGVELQTESAVPVVAPGEVLLGVLSAIDSSGIPMVVFPQFPESESVAALATIPVLPQHIGRQVALLFTQGMHPRPIVIGFLYSPLQQVLDNIFDSSGLIAAIDEKADQMVFDTTIKKTREMTDTNLQTDTVHVDGQRVVLEGKEEVILKCGEASITLTRNGKVVIRGKYLLSRSSGVNRILGGSVQVN